MRAPLRSIAFLLGAPAQHLIDTGKKLYEPAPGV